MNCEPALLHSSRQDDFLLKFKIGRSLDIETIFLEKAWSFSKNLQMGRSPDIETIF